MAQREFSHASNLEEVEAELRQGKDATIQFNGPIRDAVRMLKPSDAWDQENGPIIAADDYVERVRAMCREWGEALTVRFYDHRGDVFDGREVHAFPEAQSLHLGGFDQAINLESAFELPLLKRLCVSYFGLDNKQLLNHLNFGQLTHLTLTETNTKALDLSPLANGQKLQKLFLVGHHKNIEKLANLGQLEEFTFSAKTGLDLSFLNGMANLRALKFNLGGAASIADIELPKLEDIAFTMVRNLAELGDMQRFPSLRRLFMQDQQQLEHVRFGPGNTSLEHLWFYNCQKLNRIEGLADCTSLKSLRWIFTDIDPASLKLPSSLTHLHMLSGKRGAEAEEKAKIEAKGYVADDHDDAWFFYK
ncbi:hypothetical protein [Erythrobacter mangrovi]|uniref:Leucine-rich repeat domain-containing protein n=1 Tax=Erythrobacter mangrovi TaxID=2739433 RepID=A0A7D3XIH1_9SPHN|nr:hypothetical protein [Erythrobacter mangrovi]QKG72133.1 hypothetical protein HQR01_12575 [Erythrobacter mangrovi]